MAQWLVGTTFHEQLTRCWNAATCGFWFVGRLRSITVDWQRNGWSSLLSISADAGGFRWLPVVVRPMAHPTASHVRHGLQWLRVPQRGQETGANIGAHLHVAIGLVQR